MEAMIDLETWGKLPGCQIRSVGAVMFDPYDWSKPMQLFYANTDTPSQGQVGMHRDPETVQWWNDQSAEAQAVFSLTPQFELSVVLPALFEFVGNADYVWSHGKEFDLSIIEDAAARYWLTPPWKFWNKMDTRTVYRLASVKPETRPGYGIKHHAMHDAYNQAYAVQTAFMKLTTDIPNGIVPKFLRGK